MVINVYPKPSAFRPGEKEAIELAMKALTSGVLDRVYDYPEGKVEILNRSEIRVTMKNNEDPFDLFYTLTT